MTPRMIVVTGCAGFIGSNIVARLCESGAWPRSACRTAYWSNRYFE